MAFLVRVSHLLCQLTGRLSHFTPSCDTKRISSLFAKRDKHSGRRYDLAPKTSDVFAEDVLRERDDSSCEGNNRILVPAQVLCDKRLRREARKYQSEESQVATALWTGIEEAINFAELTGTLSRMDLHSRRGS